MMSFVSVVMPVFRVEEFVESAVQSVLDQTHKDFELLVIDDCSPDRSIELCKQFDDRRIKIVRHSENRGLAGARNTGIRFASGDYIAFLDSDDVWEPTKLEQHLAHFRSNDSIGLSFSRSAFIDEKGEKLGTHQMPRLDHVPPEYLLCRNPIGNGSAPVVRKQVFDDIKFSANNGHCDNDSYFDESFRQSEDIECWLRIRLLTRWRIEGLSEPLTLYRLNSGGLSANIPKQLDTWEKVITKTQSYAPELIEQHGRRAKAYQLRYLSRQAIRLADGPMAVDMFKKSIVMDWSIVLHEPSRTIVTGISAYLLKLLPAQSFNRLMPIGLFVTGQIQSLRIKVKDAASAVVAKVFIINKLLVRS